jgi:hypothetical protein
MKDLTSFRFASAPSFRNVRPPAPSTSGWITSTYSSIGFPPHQRAHLLTAAEDDEILGARFPEPRHVSRHVAGDQHGVLPRQRLLQCARCDVRGRIVQTSVNGLLVRPGQALKTSSYVRRPNSNSPPCDSLGHRQALHRVVVGTSTTGAAEDGGNDDREQTKNIVEFHDRPWLKRPRRGELSIDTTERSKGVPGVVNV